jgi:hypothetical protein
MSSAHASICLNRLKIISKAWQTVAGSSFFFLRLGYTALKKTAAIQASVALDFSV